MMDHRLLLLSIAFLSALSSSFSASPSDPWQVTEGNQVCITAYFKAQINLTYIAVNGAGGNYDRDTILNVPDSATVMSLRSFCDGHTTNNTQAILINWLENNSYSYNLTIQFVQDANSSYAVQQVSLEYDLSDSSQFPFADLSGKTVQTANSNWNLVSVPLANSYQCLSGFTIPMELENASLVASVELSQLRLEAFRTGANNSWVDPVEICAGDVTTTTQSTTTESTTTESTTTETTTSVAPGPLAKWSVKADNGDLCILASFTGRFHVDYTATNQKTNTTFNTSAIVEIPESGVNVDTSRSFCDTYTLTENQQITLYWLDHSYRFNLTLKFNHDVNNTQNTEISWVALEYDLDDRALFPEATPTVNNLRTAESSAEVGTISHGMYLKCDSGVPVSLVDKEDPERSVDGVMFGVKVEAFRNSKTSTFDDHPEVCPGDAGNVTTPSPPHTTTPWPINMPRYEVFFPENGTACLLATFDLDVETWYFNSNNTIGNRTDLRLNNATVNKALSQCGVNQSILALENFYPGWILRMIFNRRGDRFALDELTLNFNLTNFPNSNDTAPQYISTRVDDWSTQLGGAYKCDGATKWSLNTTDAAQAVKEIKLSLDQIHVQAFVVNGTFGDDVVCSSGGGDASEIVPIAVGCALAALVIIVLIAYVIGRRRNRARGYESM